MINVKKGIEMNKLKVKAPTGNKLICKGWHQEAAENPAQQVAQGSKTGLPALETPGLPRNHNPT